MDQRLQEAAEQKAGLVAQQEADNARAKDLEGEAQVSSAEAALSGARQALEVAEANARQYTALSEYTRIVPPFTGAVTVRYAGTRQYTRTPTERRSTLVHINIRSTHICTPDALTFSP